MKRRNFIKATTALALTQAAAGHFGFAAGKTSSAGMLPIAAKPPFLLSTAGCGRATGYAETNKIITVDGKTHVAWLDSEGKSFLVRVRTLDRKTRTWSKTFTIGKAYDNHGGPALTVDSRGHLHIVYYPHHHPFRYRRSLKPNDASAWTDEVQFGRRSTYPTLLCGADDTLYLTCRESGKGPWVVQMYTKKPGAAWEGPTTILRSGSPSGYSHFQEALAWGPDRKTMHLTCRFYDGNPGIGHTVGYMKSPDAGQTWQTAEGKQLTLPATPDTVTCIARDTSKKPPALRGGAIALDAGGNAFILHSTYATTPGRAFLTRLSPEGRQETITLNSFLPPSLNAWSLGMPGGITITQSGGLAMVLTLQKHDPAVKNSFWGHPTSEVITFSAKYAAPRLLKTTFRKNLLIRPDPAIPHWLPNLERPTGHNHVDSPGILFTAGTRGDNNRQIVANKVFWSGDIFKP